MRSNVCPICCSYNATRSSSSEAARPSHQRSRALSTSTRPRARVPVLLSRFPLVDLVLLIDPDAKALSRSQALAPSAELARSINQLEGRALDAIVIATPGYLHASHALAALRYGSVFLEKPMATCVADAKKLVDARNAHNRVGMVGYLLHHDAVRTMLTTIREGRIGTPTAFHSARLCVRGSRDVDGSLLWSLARHDVSILRAIDPSPVCRMTVDTRLRRLTFRKDSMW